MKATLIKTILTLASIAPLVVRADDPKRIPVVVEIDHATYDAMDATNRAAYDAIRASIEAHVYTYGDFPINPPPSVFADGTVVVKASDLYKAPTGDEVGQLGGTALSAAQLTSIREEGLLIVPSTEFPGQNHVWQLSEWIQEGSDKIRIKFERGKGEAYNQVVVQVGERIAGNFISAKQGVSRFGEALGSVIGHLVGKIEKRPRFTDEQVVEKIQKLAAEHVVGEASVKGTLNDPELIEKVRPILSAIQKSVDSAWTSEENARETVVRGQLVAEHFAADQVEGEINKRFEAEREQLFYDAIRKSPELAAFGGGIPEQLINRHRANQLLADFETKLGEVIVTEANNFRERLKAKNPKRDDAWIEKRVSAESESYFSSIRYDAYGRFTKQLEEAGLKDEAAVFRSTLNFVQSHGDELRREFSAQTEAVKKYTQSMNIWLAKNWKVKNIGTAEKPNFYATKTTELPEVSSAVPLWRLFLIATRGTSLFNNGLKGLLLDNLWNGPLGLRTYGLNSFYRGYRVNQSTGAVELDPQTETLTYWQRFKKLHQGIQAVIAAADAKQKLGPFSPGLYRTATRIKFGLPGYVLGYPLLAIGSPLLTLANLGFCAAATCASVPLAYGAATVVWGVDALVVDLDNPYPSRRRTQFPIITDFLTGVGLGVGQFVGSIVAVPFHFFGGIAIDIVAEVRLLARSTYDAVIRKAIINAGRLTVPRGDTWVMRRISGPGLSADYLFQIKPELAILGLQTTLEGVELANYAAQTQARINAPVDQAKALLESIFGYFVEDASGFLKPAVAVRQQAAALSKTLDQAVEARRKLMPKVAGDQVPREKIRLNAEDLAKTIARSIPLVKEFYTKKIAPQLDAAGIAKFWNFFGTTEGNYDMLTKRIYANAFGSQFLVALEASDANFRLVVDEPGIDSAVDRILDGVPPPSLDTVPVVLVDSSTGTAPNRPARNLRSLNYSSALKPCESVLAGLTLKAK